MYGLFGQQPGRLLRLIYYLPDFLKLFWRLFRDKRVPWYMKAIPIIGGLTCLIYLLFPLDILPDYLAILGQLDDATVIALIMLPCIWAFIRLCPKGVTKEHARKISAR